MLIVSSDVDAPYERPPLSKEFLRGEAQDDGFLLAADRLAASDQIRVLLGAEVTGLDLQTRTATLGDGQQLSFGSCVLATGASPRPPGIPGADLPGVHLLRSLADGRALRTAAGDARSAIVVGSGFIGCEAASSLARLGLDVTLLTTERAPQEARLGERTADRLASWLQEEGVVLHGRVGVTAIEASGKQLTVQAPGGAYTADLVLLATGITHNTGLGERAGLTLKDGRIRVDSSMRTAVEGVYAAGDVALADNVAAGRPVAVEHWDDASTMGQIAAAMPLARRRSGPVCRGSGPRSATDGCSTRPGATATTRLGWSSTAMSRSRSGMPATVAWSGCSPAPPTRTSSAARR